MKTATEIKQFDHETWISKLKSYKNEIASLQNTLAEVAAHPRKREVLAGVEHFQNQFIVQRSNLNEILHSLKMDEKDERFEHVTGTHSPERAQHQQHCKELAEGFENTMSELQAEFHAFLSKNKAS
jgi:hypothetical protein